MKPGAGQQDFVDAMTEVVGRWHGSWQDPAIAESKALAYRVRRLAHRLETDLGSGNSRRTASNCGSWNCWRACSAPSRNTG